jgi:hypothetical protein
MIKNQHKLIVSILLIFGALSCSYGSSSATNPNNDLIKALTYRSTPDGRSKQEEIADAIQRGADPYWHFDTGGTYLHLIGDPKTLRAFLANATGIDINAKDCGKTALRHYAYLFLLALANANGEEMAHWAQMILILLEHQADATLLDGEGRPLLPFLVGEGNWLLGGGGETRLQYPECDEGLPRTGYLESLSPEKRAKILALKEDYDKLVEEVKKYTGE